MYKHILVPTDGSKLSEQAIKHGVALAKALKAKITAVTVSPPYSAIGSDAVIETDASQRAVQYLDAVRKAAAAAKVDCDAIHLKDDLPYRAIIAAAKKQHCDLIVMASHGRRGISAMVLGSVTARVIAHGALPVLVCR